MAPGGYPTGGRYPQDNRFPPGGPPPGWADPRWTPDGYGSHGYEGDIGPAEPPVTGVAAQQAPAPKPFGPPPALPAGSNAVASSPVAEVPVADMPVAEPMAKPEPRPEVASPSGSIPPPAPIRPTNPPELPDTELVSAEAIEPVVSEPVVRGPVVPESAMHEPVSMGTVMVDGGEDVNPDDDTAPIPVITPDMPKPAPAPSIAVRAAPVAESPANRIRAPFEPLDRKPEASAQPPTPPEPEPELPVDTKLDQIKDLYLTAEAIGEDALSKHFNQVSDRQRQLIREYFDQLATSSGQDEATS
jgi:hypothetical protein